MIKKRQKKMNFFSYGFSAKNHRGIVADYLPWLMIAIAILVISMISLVLMKGTGVSFIDKIKSIFGG